MDGPEAAAAQRGENVSGSWPITVLVMRITKAVGLPHPTATATNGSHHAPLQALT